MVAARFRHYRSGADVTFHLFGLKKDEKRVRTILTKWADRGYIANLTIADKDFVFRPLLDLQVRPNIIGKRIQFYQTNPFQSISINHMGIIRERDELILSCVARGSTTMAFRWFKDGIFVNVTEATRYLILVLRT